MMVNNNQLDGGAQVCLFLLTFVQKVKLPNLLTFASVKKEAEIAYEMEHSCFPHCQCPRAERLERVNTCAGDGNPSGRS